MTGAPVAVVDIGSNSVRLVVYEGLTRAPATIHNEKSICAIGRDMVTTGRLHVQGMTMALEALARFRILADGLGAAIREAVATAAARDAQNGQEFIAKAEAAWGSPIRILAGEEEARLAAEGVLAGIPEADGLAADLGGGSLDMVSVKSGRMGEAHTLPFGPLRLLDLAKGNASKARDIVDEGLEKISGLRGLEKRGLYAVGGIWRSVARVDMDQHGYPLHVLQHYEIPRSRALRLCDVLSVQSRKSLDMMRSVSKRRAELLPYGAIVLERLLLATKADRIVVSAYGLREGLLHARLPQDERDKDPLIDFAAGTNKRMSRTPRHAEEMIAWLGPVFPDETAEMRRIRAAICLFSDMGWRLHPDDRAIGTYNLVLHAPFAGTDHRARALIAAATFHRYSGDEEIPRSLVVEDLLDRHDEQTALRLGLAARLAFAVSASAEGELGHTRLRLTPTKLLLEVPRRREMIAGEPVAKRLGALAASLDRKGEILIG
ncbi:MAG: Ppx/GppA family phosphatase [Alphaproteobacteria bacterium]|nr:Ppx/GppA family phosphatase [Alphaproteobacteria bacterium]MBV9692192.1 Ppx/GppA family phosphatase [Alphaproteobacteria bacterium]